MHEFIAFYRRGEEQTLLVLLNYRKEARSFTLPEKYKIIVLNNLETLSTAEDGKTLELYGYQAVILEM